MAIPNFFQQQQQSLQTGLGLGQAMVDAQQRAMFDPMKQQMMQGQVEAQGIQNQLGQQKIAGQGLRTQQAEANLAGTQQQTESQRKADFDVEARQDVAMLFNANQSDDLFKKVYADIAPKYENVAGWGDFMDTLGSKDMHERNKGLLMMQSALNPEPPEKPMTEYQRKKLEQDGDEGVKDTLSKKDWVFYRKLAKEDETNNTDLAKQFARSKGYIDRVDEQLDLTAGNLDLKASAKVVAESAKSIESIRTNMINLDRVADLVDQGAESGYITSALPSIRKASIELDTLQKRLGLDVVASTTFGALSAGELKVAMSTALPMDLSPPDLKAWAIRKKNAQEKLSNYLSDYVQFLTVRGNTLGDWVEIRQAIQKSKKKNESEGPLNWSDM